MTTPTVKLAGFTQSANGTFSVYLRPGTPHCGPRTRATPLREAFDYQVTIGYHSDALDEHGFLVDNTWFAQYFEAFSHAQIGISCERLCCLIASDIATVVGSRICKCNAIAVRIKPVTGVWVECTYVPEVL